MGRINLSIRSKIILITVTILFFAIGANTLTSSYVFSREYSKALESRAFIIGQNLKLELDRLLSFGIPLHNLAGFEKQCQKLVNQHTDIAYAMVVDFEGRILFHNDPAQQGQIITNIATVEAIQNPQNTVQIHSDVDQQHYDFFIPIFGQHGEHLGAVRIGYPTELISQKVKGLFIYSILVALVSFGLAMALLIVASSTWVTKPLLKLVDTIQGIKGSSANLAEQVNASTRDEIKQLNLAFHQLMTNLEESQAKIKKYTQELELKVEERTAALKEINKQLERDIRERKRTEKKLRESEASFRILFERSPDALVLLDPHSPKVSWEVLDCNEVTCQMNGYSREELIGQSINILNVTEGSDEEREIYLRQLQRKGNLHYETYHRHKNGTVFPIEVSTSLISVGDRELILGIDRDITERKQAEEALAAANQELERATRRSKELARAAEAANEAKSQFLANMSHEIRTPMNAVIGMTGLLLDTPLSPEQRDFVETIRVSGDALLTIINDILDFSKIEAGKLELEQQPFNLQSCLEESLDLIAPEAAEKRLNLAYLIDEATPTMLVGDVTRLRQILVNLLGNAVKFTEQGEVVVSVKAEGKVMNNVLETEQNIHHSSFIIHFSVRDTGIGIPTDRRDRLFRSFSQVDASTTRHYGGTGLGLAISKRLSEIMDGAMWVESEGVPGQGSTFHFTIVVGAAPEQKYEHSDDAHLALAGKRLLIVDDNETNRRILAHQTQSWGMLPRVATSAAQALTWINEGGQFDLAILDMQMPEMDGLTLASEIRKHREAQLLPLVMLSSIGQQNLIRDLPEVEFAAFLHKPIKQSQLHNVLERVIAGQVHQIRSAPVPAESDSNLAKQHLLHILLAEDNVVNQKVALRMLERIGYQRVDVASNGLEVLDALQRQGYDVVLMDVQMPELDGLEASRCIGRDWPLERRPRIIAMTANAMEGDREQCLEAGMDDYISKPVQKKALIRALSQCHPISSHLKTP